ncbi:hypothetical protein EVAR_52508_1 [Eumeta japonica]|uniref:Uncharacterized protein n=1 Tax=Eumeta variegata TaxID=151549 RepID=A0A4C1ZNW8_EUMVA|nr:hypothetical protein EVAR_52508_1 [Eumeta japonica]
MVVNTLRRLQRMRQRNGKRERKETSSPIDRILPEHSARLFVNQTGYTFHAALRARRRIAGLVMPWMLSRSTFPDASLHLSESLASFPRPVILPLLLLLSLR